MYIKYLFNINMYPEVSLVISLGLILILILTHFDFKSKLFDFENELKTNKIRFYKRINNLKNDVDGKYSKIIGPVDCKGEWKCNRDCIKTFVVDTLPKYGGAECPTEPRGETMSCAPGDDNCCITGNNYCPLY